MFFRTPYDVFEYPRGYVYPRLKTTLLDNRLTYDGEVVGLTLSVGNRTTIFRLAA
jgi:hypothetical protein